MDRRPPTHQPAAGAQRTPLPWEQQQAEEAAAAAAAQQPQPPAAQPPPAPQPTVTPGPAQPAVAMPPQAPAAPELQKAEQLPPEWPYAGYDGPQPWEVSQPPQITHDRGFVASGAAGERVVELAACLAHLGYGSSISEGKNPHDIYGASERAAVDAFRRDYGVIEEPSIVKATTPSVVGVWTWEALFRAVRAKQAEGSA